jgi:hypothetical protein
MLFYLSAGNESHFLLFFSGTSSVSQRDEPSAFSSQFDEVDRAIDNLAKSGKLFSGSRRESMPMMMMGRHFPEYGTTSPMTIWTWNNII